MSDETVEPFEGEPLMQEMWRLHQVGVKEQRLLTNYPDAWVQGFLVGAGHALQWATTKSPDFQSPLQCFKQHYEPLVKSGIVNPMDAMKEAMEEMKKAQAKKE